MSDSPRPPATVTMDRREQTIQALVAGFAQDRITLDELERRLDIAHRTADRTELDALIADLPADASGPAAPQAELAHPSEVRDNQFLVAIMGGVEKTGRWTPARRTVVLAFMGGAQLDLREAVLPPGEIEISIFTIWGGVEIIVPPDVEVDVSGIAIMGAFEQPRGTVRPRPGAPVIRVTGFAMMAGVEVYARYPGETAKEARLRLKEERRKPRRRLPSE
jgi:Cell wall-active antibiotics response 4TMS YvqF/Domain of unknown function (DUF1707)